MTAAATLRVSVVLAARNAARTIADQLAALARQETAYDHEVVVVDNGSSDRTPAIAVRFARADSRIRVLSCSDVGVSPARNRGIRAARGALVLLCDADDVVAPQWLEAMVSTLARCDLVGGSIDVEALNPSWVGAVRRSPTEAGLPTAFSFLPYAIGANLGFRRGVFEAIGGFDPAFGFGAEEIDFCWRAQYHGFRLGFTGDAVVHYRLKSGAGASLRQYRGYALGNARLYAKHRALGRLPKQSRMTRAGMVRDHVKRLLSISRTFDPARRLDWAAEAGWFLGAAEGWIRHRVVV